MSLSNFVTKIEELYFNPDPRVNMKYRPTHEIMKGFREIPHKYLSEVFNPNNPVIIGYHNMKPITLKWVKYEFKKGKNVPPVTCQLDLKSFTNEIEITFEVLREGDNKITSRVSMILPMLCDYEETDPWNVQDLNGQRTPNAMGGYFNTPNGSIKYPITIENQKMITWGKSEIKKNSGIQLNYSFTFFLSGYPYTNPSPAQIAKMSFDGTNFDSLILSCESTNPLLKIDKINPIALIIHLTKLQPEVVKYLIMQIYIDKEKNQLQLRALVELWMEFLFDKLNSLFPEPISIIAKCQKYVEKTLVTEGKTLFTVESNMFETLNRIHQTRSSYYKGIYLILQMRRMLIATFNPNFHPSRENLITKRMITPAMYITTTIDDNIAEMLSFLKKYTAETLRSTIEVSRKISDELQKSDKTIYQIISKGLYKQKSGVTVNDSNAGLMYPLSNATRCAKKLAADLTKELSCRNLDPSQDKIFCPYDVPEHKDVGLASGLVVIASVPTVYQVEIDLLTSQIYNFLNTTFPPDSRPLSYIVIIDTHVIREVCSEIVDELCKVLRQQKRRNFFCRNDFGVTKDPFLSEIRITIGTGRIVQPILIVEDGKLGLTDEVCQCLQERTHCKSFSEFLTNHPDVIEIIDTEQHKCASLIAEDIDTFMQSDHKEKYQFCYLSPSCYVGWVAAHKNLVNCDAAIRGIYSVNHFRGATTANHPMQRYQFESGQSLMYAHKLLITNPMMRAAKIGSAGFCKYVWVAYIPLESGANQEDGIVANSRSIKSGMFDVISFKRYFIACNRTERETITRVSTYNSNHRNIDQRGLPYVNSTFVRGDAMVKKIVSFNDEKREAVGKDESEMYYEYYPARVEYVEASDSNVKILTIAHRVPQQGDKFTSAHAQKCTISYISDEANLPRRMNGKACQFYCNPIANTSRNTNSAHHTPLLILISMLTDMDENVGFTIHRSSPINTNFDPEYNISRYTELIEKTRKKYDFWPGEKTEDIARCSHPLYSPVTGLIMPNIACAPLAMIRLRQNEADKKAISGKGRVNKTTKMTLEKRKNGGSSKIDEMTRNCVASHGASYLLHELLSEPSTRRKPGYSCGTCGMELSPIRDFKQDYYACTNCLATHNMTTVIEYNTTHVILTFKQQQLQRGIRFMTSI
jgi:DNA-directed RNA polymerase beta subunit